MYSNMAASAQAVPEARQAYGDHLVQEGTMVSTSQSASWAFGMAVRERRLSAGLTQVELAARSGLSVRSIRKMERGRSSRPYHRSVRLLSDALQLDDAPRSVLHDLACGRDVPAAARLTPLSQLPVGAGVFIGRKTRAAGSR
jgi:transcriptional regulator with XRE-family HTH domain